MAKKVTLELEKFHLTKEEDEVVAKELHENEDNNADVKISFMMTLKSIWRLKDGVAIRMVESNLFVFQFFAKPDKERIVQGMPWFFDNQLLLRKEINGDDQIAKVVSYCSPCWIRVYDLPFAKTNVQCAKSIRECMGSLIEYDNSDPSRLDNFMRMKVDIDIGKPLRRGIKVATSHNPQNGWPLNMRGRGTFAIFLEGLSILIGIAMKKKKRMIRWGNGI
ncbi:F-box protein pof9 [Bienertia sinuspersici]